MADWGVRLAISLLGFGAVALLIVGLGNLALAPLGILWRRRQASDALALDALFLHRVRPVELWLWIAVGTVVAGLLGYVLTASLAFALLLACVIPLLPRPVFSWLRQRRRERFEAQLPAVLDQLASSARSGLSLEQCIDDVARRGQPPGSEEFGLMLKDMRIAAGPRAAIIAARERIDSRSFNLVASALLVSLDKGGNLPDTLDQISRSLKELWRLEQKLITASAEARKAVRVITAMPILLFFLISATQPELIDTLVGHPLGWVVLGIAALLYGIGFIWLRRILAVDL
ncbi:MAG: hypothetical protein EOM22_00325 [Gammaproteobacteria bacterium]|nr:hypothetical protein [Gammaproteobacteria bacterium]